MRLTSDVILACESYLNAFNDREITFRGKKIPTIENLSILQDGYDVIDFSDNEIRKIDNFPIMNRLSTLLFSNNMISRIHPSIGKYLPNVSSIMLQNNKIQHYYEIEHLSSLPNLQMLSLLENPITMKPYYREYIIYKIPHLKMLDFQKISVKDHQSMQQFFEQNPAGKQFLQQVEVEKQTYYQQLQQRQQQNQQNLATTLAMKNNNNTQSSNKPLVLTEAQKQQVKEAIERATTKEEIELIEHQLKTGTFQFKATDNGTTNHSKASSESNHQDTEDNNKNNSNTTNSNNSHSHERGSYQKPLQSQDYSDMDVID